MSSAVIMYPRNNSRRGSDHMKPEFLERGYSFVVDHDNIAFNRGLRRKSFTGAAPHPLLHQISSEGKVSIPVEHITEEYNEDDIAKSSNATKSYETKKLSPIKFSNIAMPQEKRRTSHKTKNSYPENYDPSNYEFKPIENNNLKTLTTNFKDMKATTASQKENRRKSYEEKCHDLDIEIAMQDDFMKKHYKLQRFFIIPDGNCLYRAAAQSCLLDQSHHSVLRQLAVEHIKENKEEFQDIVEGDIDVFLSAAQLDGEWAGYPEILALSRILDVNINVTTGGAPGNPKVQLMLHHFESKGKKSHVGKTPPTKKSNACTQRQSIWLSWLSSGHYDTFTEKSLPNTAYDEWLASKQSRLESDAAIANRIYMDDVDKLQRLQQNQYDYCGSPPAYHDIVTEERSINKSSSSVNQKNATVSKNSLERDFPLPPHEYPNPTMNTELSSRERNLTNFDHELASSLYLEELEEFKKYSNEDYA